MTIGPDFSTLLFLSDPQLVPKVMRAGKGTEVNNCASLICGRHHRGTKIGPNEAEIRQHVTLSGSQFWCPNWASPELK